MTHPHPNRRFVPQAVLTRSGKINTAGASVNTAVRPVNIVGSKTTVNHPRPISNVYKKGYSQVTRPFNKYSANKNSIFNKKVNTVRVKDTTARDRAVVSENKEKGVNVVKASACWGNPQQKEYKEKGVIDSGCSRHMTGNKCYLTEYEDYDGGFVSFGDGKGRISGKGKIKTGTLDFDNVYFCKELKYNLFSVSQICDKKNNVLFTDTECLVLSSDFKLLDESQVLLRAEAVNTACYVLNRVLVIKPHTKTPYELIHGRTPLIDFMKPFRCPVTILNTRDHLGKFDGKADEGFFVGYSVVSKAMRVFNKRTRIVEETLNIRFLENAPNVTGNGPDWLFDVDSLTIYMNYVPVKSEPEQEYILIPFCTTDLLISQGPKDSEEDVGIKPTEVDESGSSNKGEEDEQGTISDVAGSSFTNDDPSSPVNAAKASNAFEDHLFEQFSPFKNAFALPHVPNVFLIDDTGIFGNAYDDEDVGAEADLNNLEITMNVSPIPTTRIDKDHTKNQIIRDLNLTIQTRRMTKISNEHAIVVSEHSVINLTLLELVCERQDNWKCVLTRLINDLLALDSKVRFDISDRRLELTATFSIPTYSERLRVSGVKLFIPSRGSRNSKRSLDRECWTLLQLRAMALLLSQYRGILIDQKAVVPKDTLIVKVRFGGLRMLSSNMHTANTSIGNGIILMASIRATGANDSSKSIPSS
ncbi:ribonuclease H-like domain-containing protein [Tanacetum coccineum]|uniref:Ribonuclease H-like domain-containing protein n=1 Tax=Tanacetum coccineum TaxID=301880 RepID=A0ABQ5A6U2_9ASTR